MALANRIFAICIVFLGAGYLYSTWLIKSIRIGDPVGPKVFPIIVGIGIILSALGLLFESWREARSAKTRDEATKAEGPSPHNIPAVAAVIAWMALYVILMEPLGFMIACTTFLLGMMAYFHRNHWATNIAVSVIFSVTIYTVLTKLLQAPLPPGILSF
jgi:putative tricarboxylic transport membrane protein